MFVHRFAQQSDSGLNLELLQKYLFIPLDIFRKIHQNKGIQSKLEAWLAFLSMDEPEEIIRLLEAYPEFKPLYRHAYDMCRNVENIMGLFSEELRELDRNTVQYMIDEMQEDIDRKQELLELKKMQLEKNRQQLEQQNQQLEQSKQQLEQQNQQLAQNKQQLEEKDRQIAELMKLLQSQ